MSAFYFKIYMNKVKIASDKTENKQINLYFTRKYVRPLHKSW